MMDPDERDVCSYLKTLRGQFVSGAEICRRASSSRRHRQDPNWAYPILERLVEKKVVEADTTGHYRIPNPRVDKNKKFISPHIRAILDASGKKFDGVIELEEE